MVFYLKVSHRRQRSINSAVSSTTIPRQRQYFGISSYGRVHLDTTISMMCSILEINDWFEKMLGSKFELQWTTYSIVRITNKYFLRNVSQNRRTNFTNSHQLTSSWPHSDQSIPGQNHQPNLESILIMKSKQYACHSIQRGLTRTS